MPLSVKIPEGDGPCEMLAFSTANQTRLLPLNKRLYTYNRRVILFIKLRKYERSRIGIKNMCEAEMRLMYVEMSSLFTIRDKKARQRLGRSKHVSSWQRGAYQACSGGEILIPVLSNCLRLRNGAPRTCVQHEGCVIFAISLLCLA